MNSRERRPRLGDIEKTSLFGAHKAKHATSSVHVKRVVGEPSVDDALTTGKQNRNPNE